MYRHPDEMTALIQPSNLHNDSKGVRRPTRQLLSPISVRIRVGCNLHNDSYYCRFCVCNVKALARWPVPLLAASSGSAICLFSSYSLLLNRFFVLNCAASSLATSLQRTFDNHMSW